MLTKTEADYFCSEYCPSYLSGHYWLSTTVNSGYYFAYKVYNYKVSSAHGTYGSGLRPVITLTKSIKDISLVNNLEVKISDLETVADSRFTMEVTISPNEANNKNLKWTSSDTNIVEVNADGTIIGKSKGTATITVETTDGSNIKKEINVTILESQKLSNIATINEELEITEVNSCATTGICELGTPFALKVNDTEIKKFYVISDDGTNVTLIMSENLPQKSAWSKNDNNTLGPLPLLESIKNQTDSWTNIPIRFYNFYDDNSKPAIYSPMIIQGARTRLLNYTEAKLLCDISSGCPEYILSDDEYWLSTATSTTAYAYRINSTGIASVYYTSNFKGVRPVITLSK